MTGSGQGGLLARPVFVSGTGDKMTDCFHMKLSPEQLQGVSSLTLAHVGDAVYELLVRAELCRSGITTAEQMHRTTVSYVSAPAQAAAAERIRGLLTEEESTVFRRGRNAHVSSVPKGATTAEYHAATGLETLFGWLYLSGRTERLTELCSMLFGG